MDTEAARRGAEIVSVEARPCIQRQQDPSWSNSKGRIAALDGLIVTITDAAGRTGEGHIEAMAFYADTPAGSVSAVEALTPCLLGQSPVHIEALLAAMDRALHAHPSVKAGVDCALHDLLAHQLGVPLHALFGGARHTRFPMQRILPMKDPERMAQDAAALAAQGYRCLKIKIDADADLAVERTKAVRSAVGEAVRLSVDANQAYTAKAFLPVLRDLERAGVDLVEQPVRHDDWAGLKFLRGQTDVLIEADESARSVRDILSLIAMQACDSFNLKVMGLGGLRNTVLAGRICEAANVGYRVGTAFGPRLIAAQSAHVASTLARISYPLEFAEFCHFLDDPHQGLEIEKGMLMLPAGIGSGVVHRR